MKIDVYSRPGCHYCDKTKDYFNNNKINYTEFIVGKDLTIEETKELFPNVKLLPIILIDDEYIGGYNSLMESKLC